MFDIGWGELVVIGVVALIAIGPKELPTVLRTIGQYMGKVRRMANEFQGQFQEALREAEVADLKKQAEDWKSTVTDFANYDPLAETAKTEESGERTSVETSPVTAEAAGEAAPPALEAAPSLPEIATDLPLPELPPPVTSVDFAPAEPKAEPSPSPEQAPQQAPKQAGGAA